MEARRLPQLPAPAPVEQAEAPGYPRRLLRRFTSGLRPRLQPAALVGCLALYGATLGAGLLGASPMAGRIGASFERYGDLELRDVFLSSLWRPRELEPDVLFVTQRWGGIVASLEPTGPTVFPEPPWHRDPPPSPPAPPAPVAEERGALGPGRTLSVGLLSALAGLFAAWLVLAGLRRSGARRRRASLGRPARSQPDLADAGRRVTLTGRLLVRGAPAAEEGEPKRPAAATIFLRGGRGRRAAVSRQAGGLALAVGETVIPLEAPLEVVLGSREVELPCSDPSLGPEVLASLTSSEELLGVLSRGSFSLRSLEAGRPVRVAGTLSLEAREEPDLGSASSAYRQPACRWVLRGEARAPLRLAAEETPPPRVRPARLLWGALVGLALGLLWLIVSGEGWLGL